MVILQACTECGSGKIVCNGHTGAGKQKYHCKSCGSYRTLGATQVYTDEQREKILRVYKERASLRGVHRVHGVAVSTILEWLKKKSYN
jgi:transposase-like protein